MKGFLVFDYINEYNNARKELSNWILDNKIKYKMDIRDGLTDAPTHFLSLFGKNGGNKGKLVVNVKAKKASL